MKTRSQSESRLKALAHVAVAASEAESEPHSPSPMAAADEATMAATEEARASHRFLTDEDLHKVNEKKHADSRRGKLKDDNAYTDSASALKQRLSEQRKKDYAEAVAAVKKVKAYGRDPWDNFIQGLKFLSTSIKDGTVLINAYGVFVAKKIGVTFSVTDAPIRKSGTGIKNSNTAPKKNDYGLEVGEVVPKSVGIGIPTKQTPNNSCLKFRSSASPSRMIRSSRLCWGQNTSSQSRSRASRLKREKKAPGLVFFLYKSTK